MGININSKKNFHPSRFENQIEYYKALKKEDELKLKEISDKIKNEQKKQRSSNSYFNKLQWIRYDLDDEYFNK